MHEARPSCFGRVPASVGGHLKLQTYQRSRPPPPPPPPPVVQVVQREPALGGLVLVLMQDLTEVLRLRVQLDDGDAVGRIERRQPPEKHDALCLFHVARFGSGCGLGLLLAKILTPGNIDFKKKLLDNIHLPNHGELIFDFGGFLKNSDVALCIFWKSLIIKKLFACFSK